MSKKIALVASALLVVGLIWYLFIMPQDYIVRFRTKASSGTVNQIVKFWSSQKGHANFQEQKSLSDFTSTIVLNDTTLSFNWKIAPLNDSISQVKVYVTDSENSLKNRILLPFSDTDFEKRSKSTVKEVYTLLKSHLSNFKTTIIGEAIIPKKYCACVPLKNTQLEKVKGMMNHYSQLSGFMAKNSIELDGRPLVEVEQWNTQNDSIAYNFCFPIIKTDSLPKAEGFVYKEIKERKAIKAVYNGNYLTSDRAWYALLDYADKNGIRVTKEPLEIFHTNPNMGGNELEWEAEIFMPIQAQKSE
ncbi:GyrI-like domain-containing protein [Zobellia barbeyronii]|uniref:GyrI-like domain-containing protein n=1 Tax=Zobellia barbeyronii TaxID=2748009 RepID=A0ABS5WA36_9FLAO|nr:GyrI-like domain-containing protein [Zobellia barbeyronii]MBT2159905.1 GyrI-like domain-containing protein [Zobellia barbeyronii]